MEKNTCPVLCGGTYFTLILHAIKKYSGVGSDNLSGPDVLAGLIKLAKPDFRVIVSEHDLFERLLEVSKSDFLASESDSKDHTLDWNTFEKITSQYRNCSNELPRNSIYLPFSKSNIRDSFDVNVQNNYHIPLLSMQKFTNNYITNKDVAVFLVKALLELLLLDKSINKDDRFYLFRDGQSLLYYELHNKYLKDLYDKNLSKLEIDLPSFLLGIWHFIIKKRKDNIVGQGTSKYNIGGFTFNSWHEKIEKNTKGQEREYSGNIGLNVKRPIEITGIDNSPISYNSISFSNISYAPVIKSSQKNTPSEEMLNIFLRAVHNYRINEFIEATPIKYIKSHIFEKIDKEFSLGIALFIESIQSEIISRYESSKTQAIYANILNYINHLNCYIKYLEESPKTNELVKQILIFSQVSLDQIFKPVTAKIKGMPVSKHELQFSKFREITNQYRQQLKSLYREICGEDNE